MTKKRNALTVAVVLGAVLAFGGVACGGSKTTAAAHPTPATAQQQETESETNVPVVLSEWKITAPDGSAIGPLKAGEIKFDVTNKGANAHEMVVIKTDADPGSFPVTNGKVDEEAAGTSPGEVDDLDPGKSDTGTMRLSPGKYVLICNVPGHYQQGMHVSLTVQ